MDLTKAIIDEGRDRGSDPDAAVPQSCPQGLLFTSPPKRDKYGECGRDSALEESEEESIEHDTCVVGTAGRRHDDNAPEKCCNRDDSRGWVVLRQIHHWVRSHEISNVEDHRGIRVLVVVGDGCPIRLVADNCREPEIGVEPKLRGGAHDSLVVAL